MCEINNNQREATGPLRLDRCPDCGYLREGLPDARICPECGFDYDPEMIVLYGRPGKWTENGLKPWLSAWPPFMTTCSRAGVLLIAFLGFWLGMRPIGMIVLSVLLGGLVDIWYLFWRRKIMKDAPDVIQLRFTRSGFAQRYGVGRVRLQSWSRSLCVHIISPRRHQMGRLEWCNCWIRGDGIVWLLGKYAQLAFQCTPETIKYIREQLDGWNVRSATAEGDKVKG